MKVFIDLIRKLDRDVCLIVVLTLIFFISRFVVSVLGGSFNMDYLHSAWQNVDVWLLQHDLLRSIWYLHSQPPLFNLFIGIILNIFPENFPEVFEIIFHGLGLVLMLCLFSIIKNFTGNRLLSFIIALIFIISPSVLLFEFFFFYDFPVMVILVIITFFFQKYVLTHKILYLIAFFSTAAFLILTRRIFHIVWLLVLGVVLLYFYRKEWKRILFVSFIPLCIILLWFAKNQYYFGKFDASSWTGMGFFKTASYSLSYDEKKVLFDDGITSSNIFYGSDPFQIPVATSTVPGFDEKLFLIPVLGNYYKKDGGINYNHPAYINLSHELMGEFISILKHRPSVYMKGAIVTSIIFFSPASGYFAASENNNVVDINYQTIKTWDILFNRFIFVQPLSWGKEKLKLSLAHSLNIKETQVWRLLSPGVFLIAMYFISLMYGLKVIFEKNAISKYGLSIYLTIIFLVLNILYISAVGILAEAGENQRHRFMSEPLTWILFAYFINAVMLKIKKV